MHIDDEGQVILDEGDVAQAAVELTSKVFLALDEYLIKDDDGRLAKAKSAVDQIVLTEIEALLDGT